MGRESIILQEIPNTGVGRPGVVYICECIVCHNTFRRPNSHVIRGGGLYCSKKCSYSAGHSNETKKKISEAKLLNPTRYWLGKTRSEETKRKVSIALQGTSWGHHSEETKKKLSDFKMGDRNPNYGKTGPNSPNWKQVLCECQTCGAVFFEKPSRIADGRGLYCSQSCLGKSRTGKRNPMYGKSGELSPAWNDGISTLPYDFAFTNELKEMVKERDDYQCQLCRTFEEDLDLPLAVHHIDYDKQNSWDGNLLSLCFSCHSRTNVNRTMWSEYFNTC